MQGWSCTLLMVPVNSWKVGTCCTASTYCVDAIAVAMCDLCEGTLSPVFNTAPEATCHAAAVSLLLMHCVYTA